MKKEKTFVELSRENLIKSIIKSPVLKVIKITGVVVIGFYAFGLGCKMVNFTFKNYLELKETLK